MVQILGHIYNSSYNRLSRQVSRESVETRGSFRQRQELSHICTVLPIVGLVLTFRESQLKLEEASDKDKIRDIQFFPQ